MRSKQRGVDTFKKEGQGGGDAKRHPDTAVFEVPADDGSKKKVQLPVPPQRKQPLWVKRATGVWEAGSASDSWKAELLSRILIRKKDAANMIRLRVLPGLPAKGDAVVLANMVTSAPSTHEDVASRVRQANYESQQ